MGESRGGEAETMAAALSAPESLDGFMGYPRADGRAGTRNSIGILTTVNCLGSVAQFIADEAERRGLLADLENSDGIVPIAQATGCGMADRGESYEILIRVLTDYARPPNFGAVMVLGLCCEVMQISALTASPELIDLARFRFLTIQQSGGARAIIDAAAPILHELAETANRTRRAWVPASKLVVGRIVAGTTNLGRMVLRASPDHGEPHSRAHPDAGLSGELWGFLPPLRWERHGQSRFGGRPALAWRSAELRLGADWVELHGLGVVDSPAFELRPSLRLSGESGLIEIGVDMRNLAPEPAPFFYLAHANFRPLEGAEILEGAEGLEMTIRDSGLESDAPPEDRLWREAVERDLARHRRIMAGDRVVPEFVAVLRPSAAGVVATRQRHPDGRCDLLRHDSAQLPLIVRWMLRSDERQALGFSLPATASPDGRAAALRKGEGVWLAPGESFRAGLICGAES